MAVRLKSVISGAPFVSHRVHFHLRLFGWEISSTCEAVLDPLIDYTRGKRAGTPDFRHDLRFGCGWTPDKYLCGPIGVSGVSGP